MVVLVDLGLKEATSFKLTHTHTHTQHLHAKLWQCVYMQFMQHRKNNPIKGILLAYGMKL